MIRVSMVMAARQQITREWWDIRRGDFELFVSQLVVDEATAGNRDAADRRLAAIDGIRLLEATEGTEALVEALVKALALPPKAVADAAHIGLTVVNGIDFLLTWNCTHIANAVFRPTIEATCRAYGYDMPVICTPEELLEE